MLKNLRLKRKLLIISIPAFILISAVALYSNGIFHFSEFKPSVEVKYSMEDSAKLKELLDKSTQLNNVSSVDRVNNIIEIEGVSLNNVKTEIQDLTKDYSAVTYTVKEVSALSKGSLTALIAALYLLFISGLAIHFYFISTKGGELKFILSSYVVLLANLTISTFIGLGVLSIVSRFYKVTSLDLLLLLVAALLNYILYYISTSNINETKSFQMLGSVFSEFIKFNYRKVLLTIIVLVGLTSIGLGTAFVIHAIALFVFIMLTMFTIYWHGYILENFQNLKHSFSTRFNSIRRFQIRRKKTSPVAPKLNKKKDKKKKKKK